MIRRIWNRIPVKVQLLVPDRIKAIFNKKQLFEIDNLIANSENSIDFLKSSLWKNPFLARNFITKLKFDKRSLIMNLSMSHVLSKGLPESGFILDLGCGPGYQLKEMLVKGKIIGLDSSIILLNEAKSVNSKLLPERSFICGDTFNLPFKSNSLSGVFSRMFVYHFENWPSIFAEISRVVKVEGIVNIHLANFEHNSIQNSFVKQNGAPDSTDKSLYNSKPSIQDIEKVGTELGLKVLSRIPVQYFNSQQHEGRPLFQNFEKNLLKNEFFNFILWFETNITELLPIEHSPWQVIQFQKFK
jgi:ubiquinone/menaquinone biosynthesis C-methylase UbiE